MKQRLATRKRPPGTLSRDKKYLAAASANDGGSNDGETGARRRNLSVRLPRSSARRERRRPLNGPEQP